MPEELSDALPHVGRMLDAFRIPRLTCDGYEADDIIGTIATRAATEGFEVYMMTPDKDFGQLVKENVFLYKPAYMGNAVDVLGHLGSELGAADARYQAEPDPAAVATLMEDVYNACAAYWTWMAYWAAQFRGSQCRSCVRAGRRIDLRRLGSAALSHSGAGVVQDFRRPPRHHKA